MPITNLPGWIGSSAVAQTGQRWMSAARRGVNLPSAGWMSEMAGLPKEYVVEFYASNHSFDPSVHLHPLMLAAAGGTWPTAADTKWIIRIHSGVQLVSARGIAHCFTFIGAIKGTVRIENHGWLLGRGGDSAIVSGGPHNGKNAIYREPHITLHIVNYGVIAGGGGGGGNTITRDGTGNGPGSAQDFYACGGGGAPFGYSIQTHSCCGRGGSHGTSAGISTPGTGGSCKMITATTYGGNGGNWGQRGEISYPGTGGYPGNAFAGSGPISWIVYGDIRGPIS